MYHKLWIHPDVILIKIKEHPDQHGRTHWMYYNANKRRSGLFGIRVWTGYCETVVKHNLTFQVDSRKTVTIHDKGCNSGSASGQLLSVRTNTEGAQ